MNTNPTACNALLNPANIVGGAAALTFNATAVTPVAPYVINFNQINGSVLGGVASPMSSSLLILPAAGIQLRMVSATSILTLGGPARNQIRSVKSVDP